MRLERDHVVLSVGILYTNDTTLLLRCDFLHRFLDISLLILLWFAKTVFHVAGLIVGAHSRPFVYRIHGRSFDFLLEF